jgi:hypothetical protein
VWQWWVAMAASLTSWKPGFGVCDEERDKDGE